ncbi:hypothetical protein [Brevibacillus daliensis]|uniref:hypothetical protein n=1 Tax=Brevibacillus daliensis TaxID=2892995 RepID=UPI001E33A0A1|nr:hypothetical protein [Brevibacillus daliensis]
MEEVIVVRGAVQFPITIDPTVWVFDDRKFELSAFSQYIKQQETSATQYIKAAGAHWDKEISEGATPPSERKTLAEERKVLEGDYAVQFLPFLSNAEPYPEATQLLIHRENKPTLTFPIEKAASIILQFAKDGRPIKENGPVLLYFVEELNEEKPPIDSITAFEIK